MTLLAPFADTAPGEAAAPWLPPITGPESGFRNKAKMVVTGSADSPIMGIVDDEGVGVDLRDCPLYPPVIHETLAAIPALVKRAQVSPYNIAKRKGDLKYVLVTSGDDNAVMVRFVLRTTKPVDRIREHLHLLTDRLAPGSVVTANIQPDPKAVIEGADEIHLSGPATLAVTQGDIRLRVRPQSFLQTNSAVASGLYRQVADWVDEIASEHADDRRRRTATRADLSGPPADSPSPLRVWDLFCGVGGFALHAARPVDVQWPPPDAVPRSVTGVEISSQAIESACDTAADYGLAATFHAADAAAWAQENAAAGHAPDVLIVNPPRRGVGHTMADWIENSGIPDVVYSSCNPDTLARDLETMVDYRIVSARLLDMFPHTRHAEVVVRLQHV